MQFLINCPLVNLIFVIYLQTAMDVIYQQLCMCMWYLKCGYLIIPSLLILFINWLIISHDSMQILLKNNLKTCIAVTYCAPHCTAMEMLYRWWIM